MHAIVEVDNLRLTVEFDDCETAHAVAAALPLEGAANVWGDEIYFATPILLDEAEDAREEVPVGGVAYWPPGKAICFFFGPTPVSRGDVPRAYSPVNIFGRVVGDPAQLKAVRNGAQVKMSPS